MQFWNHQEFNAMPIISVGGLETGLGLETSLLGLGLGLGLEPSGLGLDLGLEPSGVGFFGQDQQLK